MTLSLDNQSKNTVRSKQARDADKLFEGLSEEARAAMDAMERTTRARRVYSAEKRFIHYEQSD